MVNLVGLQLETYTFNLFDEASDMVGGDLSVIANTQFTEDLSLLTAIQFTNYSKDDNRVITKGDAAFKRIALILTYAL